MSKWVLGYSFWFNKRSGEPVYSVNLYCRDTSLDIVAELRRENADGSTKLLRLLGYTLSDLASCLKVASTVSSITGVSKASLESQFRFVNEEIWNKVRVVPDIEHQPPKIIINCDEEPKGRN